MFFNFVDEKVIHSLKSPSLKSPMCNSNDLLLQLEVEYQEGVKFITTRLSYKYGFESSAWVFNSKTIENADLLQALKCGKERTLLV